MARDPFLSHQLRLLAANGTHDIVPCVGYLAELVERRVGGERFGLRVAYSHDGPP